MSKSKIILVHPKIKFEDNYPCSWIPYSVLSIASKINQVNPKDIIIYDQNRKTLEFDKLIKLYKDNILCVAFSIMTGGEQIQNALDLAKEAKSIDKQIITVFGGPHVNVLPEETLENELVDFILCGPGQNSFPNFIEALNGNFEFSKVAGLMTYLKGKYIVGPRNELTLNTMVPYNFELINVEQYVQKDLTIADRTINYISTQGCVYSCRFCYETNYKKRYSKLPCEIVLDDIENFVVKYNVNGIKFYDADWFVDINRATILSQRLADFNISWAASINPIDILRDNQKGGKMMSSIGKSGCKRLVMGIESGCDRVLKEIVNKGVTKEEIYEAASIIANHGILGSYTFIVGFPGETEVEQEETFDFVKRLWNLNPRPETRVHIYLPYPGTQLYDEAKSYGFISPKKLEDWSDFNYYKSLTPWTDKELEKRINDFTFMIKKM